MPVTSKYFGKDTSSNNKSKKKIEIEYEEAGPTGWEEHWKLVQEMRKKKTAPVDEIGCAELAQIDVPKDTRNYQTMIGLMLSAQTTDQQVNAAMVKLKEHGLTIENILNTSEKDLDALIKNVGMHNKKTKYILGATKILKEKHDSKVPNDYDQLLQLPGVGPKMTLLILSVAFNNTVGISVDTHVHRIVNRLGWTKTKQPEQTRKSLEKWMPKDQWLNGFGQEICRPVGPKCENCLLNNTCPSASIPKKNSKNNNKRKEPDSNKNEDIIEKKKKQKI